MKHSSQHPLMQDMPNTSDRYMRLEGRMPRFSFPVRPILSICTLGLYPLLTRQIPRIKKIVETRACAVRGAPYMLVTGDYGTETLIKVRTVYFPFQSTRLKRFIRNKKIIYFETPFSRFFYDNYIGRYVQFVEDLDVFNYDCNFMSNGFYLSDERDEKDLFDFKSAVLLEKPKDFVFDENNKTNNILYSKDSNKIDKENEKGFFTSSKEIHNVGKERGRNKSKLNKDVKPENKRQKDSIKKSDIYLFQSLKTTDSRSIFESIRLIESFILYGPNSTNPKPSTIFKIVLLNILSPLLLYNLFGVILWFFIDYPIYATIILLMNIISLGQDIFSDIKKNNGIYYLANKPVFVTVFRDNSWRCIDSRYIFPGDLIVVDVSVDFTCDIRIIKGEVVVDESFLTGESVPIYKNDESMNNMVYSGTKVLKSSRIMEIDPIDIPKEKGTNKRIIVKNITKRKPKYDQQNDPKISFMNDKEKHINQIKHKDNSFHNNSDIFLNNEENKSRSLDHEKAIGIVLNTGFDTSKGQLVKNILNPKPIDRTFQNEFISCVISLLILAIMFIIPLFFFLISKGILLKTSFFYSIDLVFCLLSPALPTTLNYGTSMSTKRLRSHKIIVNDNARIGLAGKIDVFVFDKTGTMTEEGLSVYGIDCEDRLYRKNKENGFLIECEDSQDNEFSMNSKKDEHNNEFGHINNESRTDKNNDESILIKKVVVGSKKENEKKKICLIREAIGTCHSVHNIDDKLVGDPLDVQMFMYSESKLVCEKGLRQVQFDIKENIMGPFMIEKSNNEDVMLHYYKKNEEKVSEGSLKKSGPINNTLVCSNSCEDNYNELYDNFSKNELSEKDDESFYYKKEYENEGYKFKGNDLEYEVPMVTVLKVHDFDSVLRRMCVVVENGEQYIIHTQENLKSTIKNSDNNRGNEKVYYIGDNNANKVYENESICCDSDNNGSKELNLAKDFNKFPETSEKNNDVTNMNNEIKNSSDNSSKESKYDDDENDKTKICENNSTNPYNKSIFYRKVFVKGSPESIRTLLRSIPAEYDECVKDYAMDGFRVIAMAYKEINTSMDIKERNLLECDLEFLCFIIFGNNLKEETTGVLEELHEGQIETRMATGDNILTAISVARQSKMVDKNTPIIFPVLNENVKSVYDLEWFILGDEVITFDKVTFSIHKEMERPTHTEFYVACEGSEYEYFKKENNEYFKFILEKGRIFARMNPEQKKGLIEDLSQEGYSTGFCGDGANDCGALGSADIGISLAENEASMASSFTSTVKNISSTLPVLKEGRSSLITSISNFQFILITGIIQFFSLYTMSFFKKFLNEFQTGHLDLLLILPIAYVMVKFGPGKILNRSMPPYRLFENRNIIKIVGNIGINIMFIIIGLMFTLFYQTKYKIYENKTKSIVDGFDMQSMEGTFIFIISAFQIFITGFILIIGKPHRESRKNIKWYKIVMPGTFTFISILLVSINELFFDKISILNKYYLFVPLCMGAYIVLMLIVALNIMCLVAFNHYINHKTIRPIKKIEMESDE